MRAVIQRSLHPAFVKVNNKIVGRIKKGLIVYLGICDADNIEDIAWLSKKLIQLRIFNDLSGKMNLSVSDIAGELLIISQFTLFASTKKGNRPSYVEAGKPAFASALFDEFIQHIDKNYEIHVETGVFGAHMEVSYVNDGPVTIFIDSKNKT